MTNVIAIYPGEHQEAHLGGRRTDMETESIAKVEQAEARIRKTVAGFAASVHRTLSWFRVSRRVPEAEDLTIEMVVKVRRIKRERERSPRHHDAPLSVVPVADAELAGAEPLEADKEDGPLQIWALSFLRSGLQVSLRALGRRDSISGGLGLDRQRNRAAPPPFQIDEMRRMADEPVGHVCDSLGTVHVGLEGAWCGAEASVHSFGKTVP
jgi:hypothetical protein